MKKRLFLLLSALLLLCLFGCGGEAPKEADESPEEVAAATAAVMGTDSESWAEAFPLQYASWMRSKEMEPSPTGYGGSVPVQKLDISPEMKLLYGGIGFSKDYKEDRGHIYAWEDLHETERVGEKTPTSCLVCKTPYVAELYEKEGWDFAAKPLFDHGKDHPEISCVNCHDPATKELRVIQPAFVDAFERLNWNLENAGEKDMRSFVCAQCHVEYYFEPSSKRVVLPWDEGLSAEEMYTYYSQEPFGFSGDFTNTVSGVPMLKTQHPDYEEFSTGVHAQAGLSCADCHMPLRWSEDGTEYTSHQITSPLKNIEEACLWCHKGKTEQWLLERVRMNQDAVASLQTNCGINLEETHKLVAETQEKLGIGGENIQKAREALRKAQWYYDFVAAANSMGAHSPVQAMKNLATAMELTGDAKEFCYQALAL